MQQVIKYNISLTVGISYHKTHNYKNNDLKKKKFKMFVMQETIGDYKSWKEVNYVTVQLTYYETNWMFCNELTISI